METPTQVLDNLLSTLNKEAGTLLNAAGVHSVLDYAWEGEDTPSSKYLGLAIWTSDAPFRLSWNVWDRSAPPPMPSQRDETFYKAGEDFIGTMELARNAIGLTLYSCEHRKPDNIMDDAEYFWEHSAAASIWMNIAADRIRDYFVMARFGVTAKEYATRGRGNGGYLYPFRAQQPNEAPRTKEAIDALVADVKKLEQRRNSRNKIVHEVASRQGSNAVLSLKSQREESSKTPYVPRSTSELIKNPKGWNETIEALSAERKKELEDAISDLKEWYLLLVHAAGLAFEYEYWKRIGK
jgi:hypothetical protein